MIYMLVDNSVSSYTDLFFNWNSVHPSRAARNKDTGRSKTYRKTLVARELRPEAAGAGQPDITLVKNKNR